MPVVAAGLEEYRAGRYFEAHERWEERWLTETDPVRKRFLQGLIQLAASMHKALVARQPRGAARLLARAVAKLRDAPSVYEGIDVARLLDDCERARLALARNAPPPAPAIRQVRPEREA